MSKTRVSTKTAEQVVHIAAGLKREGKILEGNRLIELARKLNDQIGDLSVAPPAMARVQGRLMEDTLRTIERVIERSKGQA